jgi:hypothetical protein
VTASGALFWLYIMALAAASFHIYRTPIYAMDSIQYMGNALLMEDTDPVRIHQRIYLELDRSVPKTVLEHLKGNEADVLAFCRAYSEQAVR